MSQFGKIAGLIIDDYYQGRFDLSKRNNPPTASSWSATPQVECVQYLRDEGIENRTILLYLTLLVAIDRGRNSERLWWNGLDLYESHPAVFDPLELLATSLQNLSERLSDFKVTQNKEQDPQAWLTIAQTIALESSCPVSRIIYDKSVDARQLMKDLVRRDEQNKSRFPLLSGTKTSLNWIRLLARPGLANVTHLDALPISVDAHVSRATHNLGMVKEEKMNSSNNSEYIQSVWRSAMANIQVEDPDTFQSTCAGLDPALAFLGRYGCGHCEKVGQPERMSLACNHCRLFL